MTSYIPSSSPIHTSSRPFAQTAKPRLRSVSPLRLALCLAIALFGIFGLASPATAQAGPVVTITAKPPAETQSTAVSFTFTTNGPGNSTCTLQFEGSGPCTPGTPVTYSGITTGSSHNFTVEFCTSTGSCAKASYNFTVLPPPASVTITEAEGNTKENIADFSWVDKGLINQDPSQCSLDGQAFRNCYGQYYQNYWTLGSSTSYLDGSHTFVVRMCGTVVFSNPATKRCVEARHTWTVQTGILSSTTTTSSTSWEQPAPTIDQTLSSP